jgi:hypothetical protein
MRNFDDWFYDHPWFLFIAAPIIATLIALPILYLTGHLG